MQLFERTVEIDRLANALEQARDREDIVRLQVAMAWYVRQQDNARACDLVTKSRAMLAARAEALPATPVLDARLLLVEAETQWLQSNFERATPAAQQALRAFSEHGDHVGCADAHGVLASIHSSAGNLPERDECLAAAVRSAGLGGDLQRVDYFEAYQARYAVLRDVRHS